MYISEDTLQRANVAVQYEDDIEKEVVKLKAYAKQIWYVDTEALEVIDCFLDCCDKKRDDFGGEYEEIISYLNQMFEGEFHFEGSVKGGYAYLFLTQYTDNVIKPEEIAWRYLYACLANVSYRLLVHKDQGEEFLKQIRRTFNGQLHLNMKSDIEFYNECFENGLVDLECFLETDEDTGENYYSFEYDVTNLEEMAKERAEEERLCK